jgi:predicted molibdopterin-dependent oxidoreductase YjgC
LTQKRQTQTKGVSSKGKARRTDDDLSLVAEMLKGASHPVILVGSEFLQYDQSLKILEAVVQLAKNINAGLLPLPAQSNLLGSILMGVYPELLPGGFSSSNKKRIKDLGKKWGTDILHFTSEWNSHSLFADKRMKVLYLIGEVPPYRRPPCDFLIFQNIYSPDPLYDADLVLPSTAFTEMDGTFINGKGRIQRVRKAAHPPGEALPDWEILCRIAKKMGRKGFDFSSASQIHYEITGFVKGFGDFDGKRRKEGSLTCEGELTVPKSKISGRKKADKKFPLLLNTSVIENTYRGFPLSTWVEGARTVFAQGILTINPEDAARREITEGDSVMVTSANFEKEWTAKISNEQRKGTLHVTLRQGEYVGANPHPVKIRKSNV